jgi:hypothetical protein
MIKLVTYYTKDFFRSKKKLIRSAKKYGINKISEYNSLWLVNELFFKENYKILTQKRGAGYWLWKPYVILKNLIELSENDYLVYSDSAIEFVNDINLLLPFVDQNNGFGIFCTHGYINAQYTKRDCFILMDCDNEKYWTGKKAVAGFMIFKKNQNTLNFVKEWLEYSKNEHILTDEINICGKDNFENFVDHRHDQSILSLLSIKWGIKLLRDSSQYGNPWKPKEFRVENEFCEFPYSNTPYDDCKYPTILNHHRKRNDLTLIDKLHYKIINFFK